MYDTQKNARRGAPLTHLYFAYGSNLDGAQMRRRCPSARLVGAAILDGYRLGFAGQSAAWGGGVATVVRDREGRVPGLVWALAAEDLDRLDRFEGHPVAYARRRLLVELDHGARRRAHVYVKDAAEATLPTEAYFGALWRAYLEHCFGFTLALEASDDSHYAHAGLRLWHASPRRDEPPSARRPHAAARQPDRTALHHREPLLVPGDDRWR